MGQVLVLGGTGFRGHLTTEQLVKDGHNVTVISRGFRYWDIFQRLAPHITHWRPTGQQPRATFGPMSGLVYLLILYESLRD